MCGIAGALVYGDAPAALFFDAVHACRTRGEDSFGVVSWSANSGWTELRRFNTGPDECVTFFPDRDAPRFYLHTSRAEPTTEFKPSKSETDIPPFRDGGIAVAHNGIIANDRQLVRRFRLHPCSDIDTAIMPELVQRLGFWQTLQVVLGGCAFGVVDADRATLYLARNFLPLTVVWQPGIVAFASERKFFADADSPFPPYRIWDLPPYTGIEFSPAGYRNPVRWGDLPDNSSHRTWHRYPDS